MNDNQTHTRQGRRFAMLLVLLSFLFFAPVAAQGGATRYVAPAGNDAANNCLAVRNPCATVGHAVGQADPGDTIRLSPGVYTEANIHLEESLTITGQQASNTILQGAASMEEAEGAVLIIDEDDMQQGEGSAVTLQNLTIRHGNPPAGEGAITVWSNHWSSPASLTVVDAVVEANQGNGIDTANGTVLTLRHSRVSQNQGSGVGGYSADISILENSEISANSGDGVHCYGCNIAVAWSIIQGNSDGIDGGEGSFIQVSNSSQILGNSSAGIVAELGEVWVADSLISGNGGSGIAVQNYVDIVVTNSLIRNNQGGGLYNNRGITEVYNTIIANNQGNGISHGNDYWWLDVRDSTIRDNGGYGLDLFQTEGSMHNTTISGNQKGGLYLEPGVDFGVYDSSIVRNRSSLDGGGVYNGGELMLVNTLVSQNRAARHGGGIYSDPSSPDYHHLELIGVTVTQNYADTLRNNAGNGGGIYSPVWDEVTLQNSILTDNYDLSPAERHPNCSGGLTSLGGNTFGDLTGCTVIEE